ncbi:hypothetical protein ACLOJK_022761, partial [Asimina triloba]
MVPLAVIPAAGCYTSIFNAFSTTVLFDALLNNNLPRMGIQKNCISLYDMQTQSN